MIAGEYKTVNQLAEKSGLARRYVRRILQCASLSPQVVETLLAGKQRPDLTLKELLLVVPLDWREQKKEFLWRL